MKYISIIFSITALSLTACKLPGTPDIIPVNAPRNNIEAVQIRTFAPQNVRLSNNKLFLWKENRTVSEIETAIRVSNRLEELDDAAFPLNKRQLELQNQVDPYDDQIRVVGSQISKINSAITKTKKDRDAKTKELNQAIAERDAELAKPAETRNEDFIKLKQEQIDLLQTQIAALNTTLEKAQADLAAQKEKKAALEKEVAPMKAELAEVEEKQAELSAQGEAEVAKITSAVDWYKDQPTSISFSFNGPTVNAEIRDWNLKFLNGDDNGEIPQSFSSDNGSIQDVAYTERAGEFKMTVYVYSKDKSADEVGALKSAAEFTAEIRSMQSQEEAYSQFRSVLENILAVETSEKVRKEADDLKSVINPLNELTLTTLQNLASQFRAVLLERLASPELVREYYTFTIRRARYDLLDRDGRICFGGEFERHTTVDGKVRKGVLKLIEGNNK